MLRPLRVLMVEDLENDANLILRQLRRAGYTVESERVENAEQMQAALERHTWDIITSDYSLPQFNAPAALALLQKSGLDIPFIVISGELSDDLAVAVMNAGAQDYLMKDKLARLGPTLERELTQARKRREHLAAGQALKASEERYRTLIEQASEGIFIADALGNYQDVNPAGCALLGYSRDEILGLNMKDLVDQAELAFEPLRMEDLLAGKVVTMQRRMVRKDGSLLSVEISAKMLADGRLQGFVRDITGREQAGDELRRLNRVYALTSQVNQMTVRTRDKQELFANVCRLAVEYGKYRMAWIGLVDERSQVIRPLAWDGEEQGYLANIREISVEDVPEGRGPTGTAVRTGQPFYCNDIAVDPCMLPWREQALKRGYRAMIALPLIMREKVIGAFSFYTGEPSSFNPAEIQLLREVTADIAFALELIENGERRVLAEEQLQKTLRQLNFHTENTLLAVVQFDSKLKITYWSSRAEQMFGWQAAEVLGKRIDQLHWFQEQDLVKITQQRSAMLSKGQTNAISTIRNYRKDGSLINCQWYSSALFDESGNLVSLQSQVLDISEQLHAEEALRESQKRFSNAFEFAPNGMALTLQGGHWFKVNRAFCEMLGYDEAELLGMNYQKITHPDDIEPDLEQARRLRAGEIDSYRIQKRFFHRTGNLIWVLLNVSLVRDDRSQPLYYISQMTDVTERKQVEETLHLRSAALEHAANAITITDREGLIQWINPAWTTLTGYTAAEAIGNTPRLLKSGLQEQAYYKVLWDTILSGEVWQGELVNKRKDGSLYTEAETITPVRGESGEITHFIAIKQDITERKLAEQALRRSEEAHRAILQTAMDGFWMVDLQGNLIEVNEAYCRMSGYDRPELLSMRISDLEANETSEEIKAHFQKIIAQGQDRFETRHRRKDGSVFDIEFSVKVQDYEGGRLVAFMQDITERKRSEQMIEKRIVALTQPMDGGTIAFEELFNINEIQHIQDMFAQATGVASVITRVDGRPITVPSNFTFLCSEIIRKTEKGCANCFKSDAALGRFHPQGPIVKHCLSGGLWDAGASITIGGHHIANWLVGQVRDEGQTEEKMLAYAREIGADEEAFMQAFSKVPAMSREHFEQIAEALFTLANQLSTTAYQNVQQARFISERKRAEAELLQAHAELEQRVLERTAELKAANLELEKAARLKDEFLASMSHELRTPLTGILGLSEAMQMVTYGELNDKQRQALKNIEVSGRHLLALINDILDLSKIEAGRFDLQIETCSLSDICQSSLQLTRGMANQKHQNVSLSMEPASIVLKADARRLKQMIVNLLGNAIKFTPQGGSLGIEVRGNAQKQELGISIWDEGIGIQPEDLQRLFQPFVQLDSSLSRQYAGTGLGLSLVQRLAGLHNGRIDVESNFGRGSRFTIVLPWSPNPASPERKKSGGLVWPVSRADATLCEPQLARQTVLMADDNETVLELVSDFLAAQDYEVVGARSGLEFLERLEQVEADIILMDIQLPGLDGIEVIRRIRSHPNARTSGLPVIAVTALAMAGDRERCLAAGANAYMSKPVQLRELLEMIQKLCPRQEPAADGT
jgi:PAS domain S-box-containing protein